MARIRPGAARLTFGSAGPSRAPRPDDVNPPTENEGHSSEETSSARALTPTHSTRTLTPTSSARFPAPSISVSTIAHGNTFSTSRNPSSRTSSSPPQLGHDDPGSGDISNRLQDLRLQSSATPPASSASALNLLSIQAALPSVDFSFRCETPILRSDDRSQARSETPLLRPDGHGRSGSSVGDDRAARRRRSSSVVKQRPYDVREEEPPRDRFHEPGFQRAFASAKAIMGRLSGVLGSSDLHLEPDSAMRVLRERADELARFECPPTRTVGLVGESGVGKSSLLNSLLDYRTLARTSNGGAACTCVVTEYRFHERADFAIDVVLFDEIELEEQLEEMVNAWRVYHLDSVDMESVQDRQHWADRAQLAQDTFNVMFAGRSMSTLLHSDASNESVLRTMVDWARELRPGDLDTHTIAQSLEECSDMLMRPTSEGVAARGRTVWPYIKKISVSLNAHILSKGLVLVDLPGLRDLNTARRNITERYLLECDEIFGVCRIGRATTDEGIKDVLERARQANMSNIGIICTQSDDNRAEEAQRDWGGDRATQIQRKRESLAAAEREFAAIKADLDELVELDDDDITPDEEIERSRLYRKVEQQRREVENCKFELQRFMITTRNAVVKSELSDLYRDKIRGDLHIFCASNTLYWENRDLSSRDKAATFLELSGIVAIRRYCMGLVSESQLRIATKYLQDSIPNLLSSVELWVQTGAGTADAEKKRAVRDALDQLEDSLEAHLLGTASPLTQIAEELTTTFHNQVYEVRQIRQWSGGAVQAGQIWSSWHSATYAAFCRQYGDHSTAAVGYHCWNEEAMAAMVGDLSGPCDDLRAEVEHQVGNLSVFITEVMEWGAEQSLDITFENFPESVRPLRTALTSQTRLLRGTVEGLCERFDADFCKLRTDALSGLRTSYFGQSMESSYRNASAESGSGSWARKKAIINGTLGRDELFTDLMNKFRRGFWGLAEKLEADVLAAVEGHLAVIRDILDMIRSDNVALESERDPEFRARVGDEVRRAKDEMERVMEAVGTQ